MSFWAEVKTYFFDDVADVDVYAGDVLGVISIDAWKTMDDEEEGVAVAHVLLSRHGDVLVDYIDGVARTDEMAQEAIGEAKTRLQEYFEKYQEQQNEVDAVEYVKDFGNGYKILTVFANQLSDGAPGDIYDLRRDVKREHPHDGVVVGYCVVDTVDGFVPLGCNDWNNTVAEAIADYTDNVVPVLEIRDMEVHCWEDMQIKYPMGREEMSEEEEEAFVADCYSLYEKEGFSPLYWSPFTDNAERIGQKINIIKECSVDDGFDLAALPAWRVRFEDGHEMDVYPEEIVPSEMRANGCSWPSRLFESGFVIDEVLGNVQQRCEETVVDIPGREAALSLE